MKYTAIRSEGRVLPYDLLDEILADTAPGQKAPDFGLPKGRRVSDEIQRVWLDAQELWSRFKVGREKLSDKDPHGTTLTRDRWIGPMLTDPVRLSYDLHFQPSALVLDGLTFTISHRAGEPNDSPPVHIEGCGIELDKRPQKYRVSPQAMVQEFLNRSESQLWGVVTNGLRFRLLRNSVRTARPTYLEFDLETILEGGHYNEFVLFYRLCHRTRLPQAGRLSEDCWLEKYYQQSVEKGGRVRDNLRDGVEEALKVLGTGFLRHSENTALLKKIGSGELNADQYHRQLLLLVYRLLFLTVAEDRHLVISITEITVRNQAIYEENYSIGRLRARAEGLLEDSGFSDLWIGLTQTFRLFADSTDTNPLGIPPLNGDLFSQTTIPDLETAQLSNLDLLKAIRWLMFYKEGNVRQRVNYAALDVEELGSVYESLLDFRPMILREPEGWKFELGFGSDRKTTGSYYTRPELVRELIRSALVPVLEERLAEAEKYARGQPTETIRDAKIKAILEISVCDPACGSGHFLLEAARWMGKELARIRVGDDESTPEQFHNAVRDVTSHCIHGVDLNPLAVDLCKLALWLEGHWFGKPLSFLDNRIKCGNSLIGVLDPSVLEEGIPDEAFNSLIGDDKKVASAFKKKNREERLGQPNLPFDIVERVHQYATDFENFDALKEESPADVRRKKEAYESARHKPDWWHDWVAANLWTATFFLPLTKYDDPVVPTHETFTRYLQGKQVSPQMEGTAIGLSTEVFFFHWQLEFPEVFQKGGFDVILGNPPWETIKLSEQEYWNDDEYISNARTQAQRRQRIEEYRKSDDARKRNRAAQFDSQKHFHDAIGAFVRFGGRFPLTAIGDINTYALFAELGWKLINGNGRAGILVPTGIATDEGCKDFFRAVCNKKSLVSLFDFENREGIFPSVDSRMKFSAITLSGEASYKADFAFFLKTVAELRDTDRRFTLTPDELALFNPNTSTCPIFRTQYDAQLARKLYGGQPILLNEITLNNPFEIELCRMMHMSDDSDLFVTAPRTGYVPLYEAKMFHQFDHRWGTYENERPRDVTREEKTDPHYVVTPRYWVPSEEVVFRSSNVPPTLVAGVRAQREEAVRAVLLSWFAGYALSGDSGQQADTMLDDLVPSGPWFLSIKPDIVGFMKNRETALSLQVKWPLFSTDLREMAHCESFLEASRQLIQSRCPGWFLAFRNIARATDERTVIAGFLPFTGIANNAARITLKSDSWMLASLLYGCLNSLVFDYCARQKAGGANLNYFILQQLPIVPPDRYQHFDTSYIASRVIQLVYTAHDLDLLGAAASVYRPFGWDGELRVRFRAELDAYFALLYGLTRDELRYILHPQDIFGDDFPGETFRVLKEREEREFGEYRTRRLVLSAYDELAKSDRFAGEKRESAIEAHRSVR